MDERERARTVAARIGLPGIPVSMRAAADAPGPGVGTGHWKHRADRLSAAVEWAAAAVSRVPPGGVRDSLDRLVDVLRRRAERYVHIAEVGQALLPDDDTTDTDGTRPGEPPDLDGAAIEIDERLLAAIGHLTAVATAVERLADAAAGTRDADEVAGDLEALFSHVPPA
jgi:hypothetical protein